MRIINFYVFEQNGNKAWLYFEISISKILYLSYNLWYKYPRWEIGKVVIQTEPHWNNFRMISKELQRNSTYIFTYKTVHLLNIFFLFSNKYFYLILNFYTLNVCLRNISIYDSCILKHKNKSLISMKSLKSMKNILVFSAPFHGKQSYNYDSVFLLLFRRNRTERPKRILFIKEFFSKSKICILC